MLNLDERKQVIPVVSLGLGTKRQVEEVSMWNGIAAVEVVSMLMKIRKLVTIVGNLLLSRENESFQTNDQIVGNFVIENFSVILLGKVIKMYEPLFHFFTD